MTVCDVSSRAGAAVPLALAAAAAAALLAAGCQDSPDRTGVEPPTGGSPDYAAPVSPSAVWANLQTALVAGDPVGWGDQLAGSFRFVPTAATAANWPDVGWDQWDRETEVAWFENLAAATDSIAADLLVHAISDPDGPGTAVQWDLIYEARIWSPGGSSTRYRGRALIDFALVGAVWQVTRWEDLHGESPPDDPTVLLPPLGEVRGALAP